MDSQFHPPKKVAVIWRGEPAARAAAQAQTGRFAAVFAALAEAGFAPEPCIYDEAAEAEVRAQLMQADAALVWVNPNQGGLRRRRLDALLREVAAAGVLVSAHPDVIDRMGVKAVLHRTRELGWGGDVRLYATPAAFCDEFPVVVAAGGARVLKPNRGNGGAGVWKVEARRRGRVQAQEAATGVVRTLPLATFMAERLAEFAETDGFVDQAFQPRLPDGMIRCYMSGDRLAGFGWQKVRALMPPGAGASEPRTYSGPDDPRFQRLRELMERAWTPGLLELLGLAAADLPMIWDADFLFGPRTPRGDDTFVLCEINASSVWPAPDEVPAEIARTLLERLAAPRAVVEQEVRL